jgi:thiol-disulfide isomerase/thioredoxin
LVQRKCLLQTMKSLLIIILAVNICSAQTYESALDQCTKNYKIGLDPNKPYNLEDNIVVRIKELRECIIGLKFPLFQATALDGKSYSLEDFKGKVVLINLWFIGCPPCVAEIPIFNQLSKEFDDKNFVIISFGLDDTKEVIEFIKKTPMDFKIFPDSHELIANKFKLNFGYPTNIFLDKEGKIIDFRTGGAMDEDGLRETKTEMKKLIEKELIK